VEALLENMKNLSTKEILLVEKALSLQMRAKLRKLEKLEMKEAPVEVKEKKKRPSQLQKPNAWVEYVQAYMEANGWEAFTVRQSKKDALTGVKNVEEIAYPASDERDGVFYYEGSTKKPIRKDAMCLSKQMWDVKSQSGTHREVYEAFEEQYVAPEEEEEEEKACPSVSKKTLAEKELEMQEKVAKALEDKLAKKAAKDALKVPKVAVTPQKSSSKASVIPQAPVKASKPASVPAKVSKTVVVKKSAYVDTWAYKNKDDGQFHKWAFNGVMYLRDYNNEVWSRTATGEKDEWVGRFLAEEGRIDDSEEAPVVEDMDEEEVEDLFGELE
jgi:hypothetical protein